MWLFVGLGNHGSKYKNNRHNVGFMSVEAIADENPIFTPFKSKFQGKVSDGRIANSKVILLKPDTYMNESGRSVGAAAQFYKIDPENIVVFHDEIDIDPCAVRVKLGGGNAGHNGLKSIQAHIGSADFWRVRIGIGRPPHKSADVSNFVLGDFSSEERISLAPLLESLASKADIIISDDAKKYGELF